MGLFDIFKIGQFKSEIEELKREKNSLQNENALIQGKLSGLGAADYYKVKDMISELEEQHSNQKAVYEKLLKDTDELQQKEERLTKNIKTQSRKFPLNKCIFILQRVLFSF